MIDIPIPLALSLDKIEHNIAIEVKITDMNTPIVIIIIALSKLANIRIGIPAPNRKAKTKLVESPKNRLLQIFFLLIGWLTKSSINSELLYT